MENIIGIAFLAIFAVIIISIRRKIFRGDFGDNIKKVQQVGDAITWIQFIFGMIFVLFIIIIFSTVGTGTTIKIGG